MSNRSEEPSALVEERERRKRIDEARLRSLQKARLARAEKRKADFSRPPEEPPSTLSTYEQDHQGEMSILLDAIEGLEGEMKTIAREVDRVRRIPVADYPIKRKKVHEEPPRKRQKTSQRDITLQPTDDGNTGSIFTKWFSRGSFFSTLALAFFAALPIVYGAAKVNLPPHPETIPEEAPASDARLDVLDTSVIFK